VAHRFDFQRVVRANPHVGVLNRTLSNRWAEKLLAQSSPIDKGTWFAPRGFNPNAPLADEHVDEVYGSG